VKPLLLAAVMLSASISGGCAATDDNSRRTLVVFAASSLTEAFTEIGAEFNSAHPGADVGFNFGSSSALARQIVERAPATVFASADEVQMETVAAAGAVRGESHIFATNVLEIVVADGNPLGIAGVADLARDDIVVVLAAPEVPIGAYSAEVLERAGVDVEPASYEENVKAVVTKVVLGEADAGIVYATDVAGAGDDADGVTIPPDLNVTARYPIAAVVGGAVRAEPEDAELADAFVAFVIGEQGQAVLRRSGFGPP
jgi:molybdate transport system substrate-binding protein